MSANESHIIGPNHFLTIQKLVKLLDNYHLEKFKLHLEDNNANLPLKLVSLIGKDLMSDLSSDRICYLIYGNTEKKTKQSFSQLASYTFKLSSFLSRNFPSYLFHNINRIQILINEGQLQEANALAEMLLDIADKIEDFVIQASVYKFLAHQALLYKDYHGNIRYHRLADEVLSYEKTLNFIYLYLRSNFIINIKDDSKLAELDKHIEEFEHYYDHPKKTIQIASRYAVIFILYFYKSAEFKTPENREKLELLMNEIERSSQVVFPFLDDIRIKTSYFMLNFPGINLNDKEVKKQFKDLINYGSQANFWQNYVNIPELQTIIVKATHYISKYHYHTFKQNYAEILDPNDKKDIEQIIARCKVLIQKDIWEPNHVNDLVSLRMVLSAHLFCLDSSHYQEGINNLEKLMITYQQVAFSASIDSIIAMLMVGYFALKQYEKCVETFKRYIKLASGRVLNADNDATIHLYYYSAQWLMSKRNQYIAKIKELYDKIKDNESTIGSRKMIESVAEYFRFPEGTGIKY
ncbi:MAG: hypothetical protein ACK4GL_04275 [Flavobacteriales bacterium]